MRSDSELLNSLSDGELDALSDIQLLPATQGRLDELLGLNSHGTISTDERAELDRLIARIDQLTILRTRARYTLRRQAGDCLAPANVVRDE